MRTYIGGQTLAEAKRKLTQTPVVCANCQIRDYTTSVKMQCNDCNGKLCRKCCPSGHGTK